MTVTLRLAHLAIAAAFLAGVLVIVGAALALDSNDAGPKTADSTRSAAIFASATPVATQTPAPTVYATEAHATVLPSPSAPTPQASIPTSPTPDTAAAPVSTPAHPLPGDGYAFIGAVWADDFMPIPYCVNGADPPVDSTGAPLMSAAQFAQTVQHAFQTWQDVPGSYVSFSYQGICSNDPFDTRDQVNTVGWGWLFSSAIGVAAPSATHGQFLRQSSFGQIYELDIVVDVRYAQSFDDEAEYINRALPYVLLHEIGHFIGLDHSEDPCSIMQPVIVDAPPVLCEVDRDGARALYPQ
jgi:Matrixin